MIVAARAARRRKLAAVIGAGLFVVLAAASGSAFAGSPREGAPQRPALTSLGSDPRLPNPGVEAPLPDPPGTTERVSVAADGSQGNGASGGVSAILSSANANQAISADGRWVAFVSNSTNLVPGSPHPAGGLYVRDRQSGATLAVPWIDGGALPAGISAAEPTISGDGGVVAFTAIVSPGSSNSLPGPTTTPYVLAWDRQSNATSLVSLDSQGQPTAAFQPSISADGRYVAYTMWATPTPTPSPTPTPDTTAPSLSGLMSSDIHCISPGASNTISVTVTDPDDAISSVTIGVSPPGGLAYLDTMSYAGSNLWQYVITAPASGWTTGYVNYTVTAHDSHGNSSSASSDTPPPPSSSNNYLYFTTTGCIV